MSIAAFDPETGAYTDGRVARGFPLGGIGSGGFCFNTDGSFGEVRCNNNWMSPIPPPRGSFLALFTRRDDGARTVLLRRPPAAGEYLGAVNVRGTRFVGELPRFTLQFADDALPLDVTVMGFTPNVPHDLRSSTLPASVFRVRLRNPSDAAVEAAVLLSVENLLGRGGSGHLGVELGPESEMRGVHGRVVYDSVAGNWQEAVHIGERVGVRLCTDQRWDPRSHRAGVVGEHLLLVERDPAALVTVCDGWDAAAERASVLDDFARDGRIASHASGRRGEDGGWRPAAAVAARTVLAPGATHEVVFALAWWMPDHVTEPSLPRHRGDGPHDGTRVGHVYEQHFAGIDAVATHVLDTRDRLEAASSELARVLEASTLPGWLRRWLLNAADSSVCNTVVPADGTLYTLEGMDWHWPMGGLTGTNDQRLSAHPYMATFFPDLDLRELDAFRRLADTRGAIPHGNGNCDLGLGTTDVPYGWPMFIKGFLPAKEWTDLTMSLVLQVGRHWRVSGRDEIRDRFWPALVRGMEYLHGLAPRGVPEGGTTYDVWDFPGVFAYSATLYLATLRMMEAMTPAAERALAQRWAERAAVCARQLDALWDDRGFFRTADDTDTIFTAALAGDWCARWAGLDPVVDPERAASHLRTQHRLLIDGARAAAGDRFRPLPWSEARPDGTPVSPPMARGLPRGEEMTYVWQVISYQACEQLYLGQVDAGMDTLRMLHDRLWHDGNGWSGGLRGNGESVYMTHPALWAVPHALGGVALDVPGRRLEIGPRVSGRTPFFFPGVWGMVEHDATSGATTIEVLRAIGDPVTVDRVMHRPPMGAPRMVGGPVTLAAGTRVEVR